MSHVQSCSLVKTECVIIDCGSELDIVVECKPKIAWPGRKHLKCLANAKNVL